MYFNFLEFFKSLIKIQDKYYFLLLCMFLHNQRDLLSTMMHGYDTYLIRRYVYFENNRKQYMIDTLYMNIKKCTTIVKNIINI